MNTFISSPLRGTVLCLIFLLAGMAASCQSVMQAQGPQMHGGVKYTIAQDKRFNRIEKGKNGSLMYDSPELTVFCENGQLQINGQYAGPVNKGDHVEITDSFQVLVNGQPRGNNMTGYAENQKRIQQSKIGTKR